MSLLLIVATILAGESIAWAGAPAWFKDSTKLSYPKYSVSCSASGPSLDQARKLAISNCKSSAIDQLPMSTRFQSVVIETERDVAAHSESTVNVVIKNLQCIPRKEEIEEAESSFTAYILCDFDLSKTEVEEHLSKEPRKVVSPELNQFAEKRVDYREPLRLPANSKSISISTAPQCQDILIRSKRSRIIRCTENPISIIFSEADKEMVIRKNGFKSKTVNVGDLIHSGADSHVFPLDPL